MDRIKGITLDSFPDYIAKRFGKGEVAAFASALSPEAGKVTREGPVKSTWYSRAVYFEILAGFAQRYGGDDPSKLVRDLSAFAADRDLKSIYRFFLKFGYPGFVLGQSAVLWKNYFEGGALEVISREKTRMFVRLTDEVYLPYTCDLIIGYGERATTLSGGKDVTVSHPVCKHRGGPHCDFEVVWS
jgi:hypothetical protein